MQFLIKVTNFYFIKNIYSRSKQSTKIYTLNIVSEVSIIWSMGIYNITYAHSQEMSFGIRRMSRAFT